jgi:hypothetical protein
MNVVAPSRLLWIALLVPACSGGQLPSHDGGATPDTRVASCANVGCAAPPMCSAGCTARCGCCSCAPGERTGDLVCTDQGCYAPAPASDGGTDGAHDAARDGAHDAASDGAHDTASDGAHDTASDGAHDAASDGGWTPAAACALPFEVGPCDAAIPVYAFVGGACVKRTYGGCQGNDNRFGSLEECQATCVSPPLPGSCPPNRVAREICLGCGPAGGCAKKATVCAVVCDPDGGAAVCPIELPNCWQGACQISFCI